jgi:asparagine synthase (glutamine-hydrolysing)
MSKTARRRYHPSPFEEGGFRDVRHRRDLGRWRLQAVGRMVAAMGHRGPDDSGTFHDDRVALGMARLAVIDLSASAHQPMANAGGDVWIVYNGETYNFAEERRRLQGNGHTFRSESDTEVVLHLYEAHGDAFVTRLRGMFALAVYDRRGGQGRERLLLARDHFGVKPLLFARTPGGLAFASELKALLASGLVDRRPDPAALRQLLTYGSVRQPRTILDGVEMLLPGHLLVHDAQGTRTARYWRLGASRRSDVAALGPDERRRQVLDALREATRLQMTSDVPLGAFLSGGVDSTLLVALMAAESSVPLRTFSIGFEDEGAHLDESDLAAATARLLGTEHTRVALRGCDVRDALPHLAWSLDQPSVDGANSYFRRAGRAPRRHGRDLGPRRRRALRRVPVVVRRHARGRRTRPRTAGPCGREAPGFEPGRSAGPRPPRRFGRRRAGPAPARVPVDAGPLRRLQPGGASRPGRAAPGARPARRGRRRPLVPPRLRGRGRAQRAPLLDRISALCARSYMSDQLLRDVDAVSMAHSLEVRVPLLDPPLADLALSLPDADRLDLSRPRGAQRGKRVLQDLVERLLPGRQALPEKRGFAMPFGSWLRGPLADALADATDPAHVRARGLLDPGEVTRTVAAFRADAQGRTWRQPWVLLILEQWCRQVLDRAIALLWCVAALSGA